MSLLQVANDGIRVADVCLLRVRAGMAQRAALSEQVPAAVEFDLDRAQALLIGLDPVGVVTV